MAHGVVILSHRSQIYICNGYANGLADVSEFFEALTGRFYLRLLDGGFELFPAGSVPVSTEKRNGYLGYWTMDIYTRGFNYRAIKIPQASLAQFYGPIRHPAFHHLPHVIIARPGQTLQGLAIAIRRPMQGYGACANQTAYYLLATPASKPIGYLITSAVGFLGYNPQRRPGPRDSLDFWILRHHKVALNHNDTTGIVISGRGEGKRAIREKRYDADTFSIATMT
jgi:hypothetical protein